MFEYISGTYYFTLHCFLNLILVSTANILSPFQESFNTRVAKRTGKHF